MKPTSPTTLLAALALPAMGTSLPRGSADADSVRQNNYLLGFRDQVTTHVVPMVAHAAPASGESLRRRQNGMTRLTNVRDFYYIVEVELAKQKIPLHLDTGSSDTWMVRDPFECVTIPGMGARTVGFPPPPW